MSADIGSEKTTQYVIAELKRHITRSETFTKFSREGTPQGTSITSQEEITTQFTFGADDDETKFNIQLEFGVVVRKLESKETLADYKLNISATFNILAHHIENWGDVPEIALVPYFSMLVHMAKIRAEEAFRRAGLHGPPITIAPYAEQTFTTSVS